jgi:hypothetical protein
MSPGIFRFRPTLAIVNQMPSQLFLMKDSKERYLFAFGWRRIANDINIELRDHGHPRAWLVRSGARHPGVVRRAKSLADFFIS